jgi:ribonuclease P protein component
MAAPDPKSRPSGEGRRYTLPREARLTSRSDFLRVFRRAGRHSAQGIALYAAINDLGRNRFGVSIGRKHGKAVARNRTRRLLKEAFRLENARLPQGFDFVVLPAHGPLETPLSELRSLLFELALAAVRKAQAAGRRCAGQRRNKKKEGPAC